MTTEQTQLIQTLDQAFKGRNFKKSISSYQQDEFFIDDNETAKHCIFVDKTNGNRDLMLHVHNPTPKDIVLWAIDGKFFGFGKGPSKCDAALFDDKEFCLMEFKFNATSRNPNTILENQQKATLQLEKMVDYINTALTAATLSFPPYRKEAFVCAPSFYPHNSNHIQSERVRFLEKFGIELFDENEKTFDM